MRSLVLICTLMVGCSMQAQNLVRNGGFEAKSGCPTRHSQIQLARHWDVPANHNGTSDYLHYCGSSKWVSLPSTLTFYQHPYEGEAVAGFYTYHEINSYREYITSELAQPLRAGQTYLFECYAVAGEEDFFQTAFQVAFTNSKPGISLGEVNRVAPLNIEPVWTSPIIRDTAQWTHLQFCYTAKGGEQHITLGNFNSNEETDFAKSDPNIPDEFFMSAYMVVDQISLIPIYPPDLLRPDLLGLPLDTELCTGDSLEINVDPTWKLRWWDGTDSNRRVIHESGWYQVEVSNVCFNDTYRFSIDTVSDPLLDLGKDTVICAGDQLILDPPGSGLFSWRDGDTNRMRSWRDSGWIIGALKNSCGESVDSLHLSLDPKPDASLQADTAICDGAVLELRTVDGNTGLWNGVKMDSVFTVSEEGEVQLVRITACGSDTGRMNLATYPCACEAWIPNAFSPNGDGLNDVFYPRLDCEIATYQVQVFNRWGELLFSSADSHATWDGTYRNTLVMPGVYLVILSYRDEIGIPHHYRTDLTLLR